MYRNMDVTVGLWINFRSTEKTF